MIQLIHNRMNTFSTNKVIYGQRILPLLNQNRNSVEISKEDILRK